MVTNLDKWPISKVNMLIECQNIEADDTYEQLSYG